MTILGIYLAGLVVSFIIFIIETRGAGHRICGLAIALNLLLALFWFIVVPCLVWSYFTEAKR